MPFENSGRDKDCNRVEFNSFVLLRRITKDQSGAAQTFSVLSACRLNFAT